VILFQEERPATLDEATWLRKSMARSLAEHRIEAQIADDLQLAASEICANAILHANPPPTILSLQLTLDGVDLVLEIEDDGRPFADWRQRMARCVAPPVGALAVSGRGLPLIQAAFDRIDYREGARNLFTGRRSLIRKRPTVLVVEDMPTTLAFFALALRRDYRVLTCNSLEQARAALKEESVDVILSDVHLDDGLGMSLPGESAEFESGAAPPVVLISGDASPFWPNWPGGSRRSTGPWRRFWWSISRAIG
jgi:anti-sigma regulatory factor (Ser/Thr protein kinase)